MAIDGVQIIKNTFVSTCDPTTSEVCPVARKTVECVYGVTVDFATSQVTVISGPPGLGAPTSSTTPGAGQRCWRMGVRGGQVAYKYDTLACPSAADLSSSPTGILGANGIYSTGIPPGYGSACPDAVGFPTSVAPPTAATTDANGNALSVYNFTAAAGNSFWLQPFAMTTAVAGGLAQVTCLQGASIIDATQNIMGFQTLDANSPSCVYVKATPGISVVQAVTQSGQCPGAALSPAPTFTTTVSAKFFNWTSPSAASTTASVAAAAPPTKLQSVPVVTFGATLSGTFSAVTLLDPCYGVALRLAYAQSLSSLSGFTPDMLSLKSITDSAGTTITLAPDSPINTLSSAPACSSGSSRRLREADVTSVSVASAGGRRLPAQGTVNFAAQATPQTLTSVSSAVGANTVVPSVSALAGAGVTGAAPPTQSSVTTGTAVVAVPQQFWKNSNPYVPDPLIVQYHSIPRVCATGNKADCTSTFATNTTYAQGAAGIAAGLFAMAAISFVIYVPSYLCGLCACTSCRCRKPRDPATLKHLCAPRSVYIIFGIINVGLLLASIAYLGRFGTAAQQLSDGLKYFGGNFTLAGELLASSCDGGGAQYPFTQGSPLSTSYVYLGSGADATTTPPTPNCAVKSYNFGSTNPSVPIRSVAGSANVALAELDAMMASCATNGCPSAVGNILTAIQTGEVMASTMPTSIAAMVVGAGKMVSDAAGGINPDQIKYMATMGGYAVMGLLAFFVAIYTVLVCKSTCACCLHGISSIFVIILTTLIFIIAGLFYVVGVAGSDICINPNQVLLNLANTYAGSGGMIGDTLNYYLTCGANPTQPVIGALTMIDPLATKVSGAATQVASLAAQVLASNGSPGPMSLAALSDTYAADAMGGSAGAMATLSTQMGYSAQAINSLYCAKGTMMPDGVTEACPVGGGVLSCNTIDPILATLWTGVCNNGVATIIGISRILIAAAVLLFIQLGVGIDMCCFHPGLTSRYWAEEGVNPEGDAGLPNDPKRVHSAGPSAV